MLANVNPAGRGDEVFMGGDGTATRGLAPRPAPARNGAPAGDVVPSVSETPDAVTFYWRPGCGFCMGLERGLGRAGIPLDKRNIWEDAEAAAVVRSVARGNETVPTVVVGEVALVNPSVAQVFAALESEAAHLLPADPG